jgi:hypothetical protein
MKHISRLKHFFWRLRSSRFWRAVMTLYNWQPLTFRGLIAVALATLAIRAFAIPEYDLVADVLGKTILALTIVIVFVAFFFRIRLAQRISAEAFFDAIDPLSRTAIQAGLVLDESSIPPYFSLRVRRVFHRRGVSSFPHLIKGATPEDGKRHLIDEVAFPHRGFWELTAVEYRLEDALGLTSLHWRQALTSGLEVSAPTLQVEPLPIVASSARAGDQLSQSRERAGDLFDIKAYDPSDGTKRILWKTFAKSGQLVVRRPEPAVIPEGEVAIYLIAKPREDYVAGALQGYLRQLDENQITVLFATDGMGPEADTQALGFVTDHEDIQKAINRAVWSGDSGTGRGFGGYLAALQNTGRIIQQVVVFAAAEGKWFDAVSRIATAGNVKLTVAMVPREIDPAVQIEEFERGLRLRRLPRVIREAPIGVRKVLAVVWPELRGSGGLARGNAAGLHGAQADLARAAQGAGADMVVVSGRGG